MAVAHSDVPVISGLLYGVQPVVIAIVVEALLRIGRRTINHRVLVGFAVLAFVALYFLSVPFPLVVLIAAIAGLLLSRTSFARDAFRAGGHGSSEEYAIDQTASNGLPSVLRNVRLLGTFILLWAVPLGALYLWRGGDDVLVKEALFFTGAAFLTFGGAYSVLSYVSDVAVGHYGWLSADQMVQGLGLAESTPGPLIMVTQYVGFIGAWNDPGPFSPLLYGTLGALITTYATFLPCFLFIFFLAPYIELLANDQRLRAILIGVTAAVVGVIANLAVYFAMQVLFPDGISLAGLDLFALVVAVVSFVVLQRYKVPIYLMVPASAVLGMAWTLLQG
jgi:chromate transporter